MPVARCSIGTSTSTTRNPRLSKSIVNPVSTPNPGASGLAASKARPGQTALPVERLLHLPPRGAPDTFAGQSDDHAVPAEPQPGGREPRDRHVRFPRADRFDQSRGRASGLPKVGVHEQQVPGGHVSAGPPLVRFIAADPFRTGLHGRAFAPVSGMPEHAGPRGTGHGRCLVAGPVVHDHDQVHVGQGAHRPHCGADPLLLVPGRDDGGDPARSPGRCHGCSPARWRLP